MECACQAHSKEFFSLLAGGEWTTQTRATGWNISKILTFSSIFSQLLLRAWVKSCHLDFCLGLGIFKLPPGRKKIGLRRPKSVIRHIMFEPYDSSKIWNTWHSGAKNLLETHKKHIYAVGQKKNLACPNMDTSEALWAPPTGPQGGRLSLFRVKMTAWSKFRQNWPPAVNTLNSNERAMAL